MDLFISFFCLMRFLVQRVSEAHVHIIDTKQTRSIGTGILVYVGIHKEDIDSDWKEKVEKFVRRCSKWQIFDGDQKKKNLGLREISGELMLISNFTLRGRNRKAGTIDFSHSAGYESSLEMYTYLIDALVKADIPFQAGKFGALMEVTSTNYGPVNLVLDY